MRAHHVLPRLATFTVLLSAPASADITFRPLGTLWTDQSSWVYGLSPDGSVPVGRGMDYTGPPGATAGRPVRWTPSGIERLPGMSGYFDADARAVSLGGAVITGYGQYGTDQRAFRTVGGVTTLLPNHPAGTASLAWTVTADGSTIAGGSGGFACLWVGDCAPLALPLAAGHTNAMATAISHDGTRVAGTTLFNAQQQIGGVFLWSQDAGSRPVPLPAGLERQVFARISGDGGTVFGNASNAQFRGSAFRWTEADGPAILPELPGSFFGAAYAASADGSILGGASGQRAVLWTGPGGSTVTDVNVLLSSLGIDLGGWVLNSVTGISADGLTIAGVGMHTYGPGPLDRRAEGWIATIPAPAGAPALLVLAAIGARCGRAPVSSASGSRIRSTPRRS